MSSKPAPANPIQLCTGQYANASNLDARIALHLRFSTNPYGWFPWVFDRLANLPPNARILELGSGSCRLWVENLGRIPAGWEAEFDAVIANHMLYHVPDRPKALASIRRILKPGGALYAATNGQNHMQITYALSQQAHPRLAQAARVLFHAPFSLENGADQLAAFFQPVGVEHYPDALEVTEVEPLVNYILSMAMMADLSEACEALRTDLRQIIGAEIAANGKVRIEKATGLFTARRA
jgi:SAM-dependent methyltransferase